jgi:hypothetical protein
MSFFKKFVLTFINWCSHNSGLLVGFIGVTILFKNFLAALPSSVLWADQVDSKLIYWIVNWGYHILFQVKQPGMFWNANSFYPEQYSLAYSDSMLSLQLLFAPLRALGLNALVALYVSLMLTVVISCWLTQFALRRIGGFNPLEIAFIVFGTHFPLSMTNYVIHYQLFGFQLAPPLLLFLFLYLRDFRLKDFIILCLLFAVGVGYATYLAPMLFAICLFLVLPYVIWRLFSGGLVPLLRQTGWQPFAAAGAFSVFLYAILFKPYLYVNGLYPKLPLDAMVDYSATPLSFLNGITIYSYWYKPSVFYFGYWESSYFPGYILLSLGLAGLLIPVILWMAGRSNIKASPRFREFQGMDHPANRALVIYMTALLFLLIFFSWGPYLVWDISTGPAAKLPYFYLVQVLPGLDSVRAPGRFGFLIGLPLSMLAIFFLKRIRIRQPGYHLLLAGLLLAVMVESIPRIPAYNFDPDPRGIYHWVAGQIQPGTVLLELPLFGKNNIKTVTYAVDQLVGSTIHWAKMPVGYGAKTSPEYNKFLDADRSVQKLKDISRIIQEAERYKIQRLLVDTAKYPTRVQTQWLDLADKCPSLKDPDQPDVILIQLDSSQCQP